MIKKLSPINKDIYLYLIGLLPLALLTGTLVPEILIMILLLGFIYEILIDKNLIPFKDFFFLFLIIIWIYLIFNYTISSNKDLSFSRTFSFIRFPLLVLSINYFLKKNDYKYDLIFRIWGIILIITILDLFFQSIFGYNTLGFKSPWAQRLAGFMKDELKIAHLLIGFVMPTISFYLMKNKNLFFTIVLTSIYIIILLLINERSNAIKGIFIIFFIILFYKHVSIKNKLISMSLCLVLITSIMSINDKVKQRFFLELKAMNIENKTFINYIKESNYGPHYYSAIDIIKDNKIFGTGMKTFRVECLKPKVSDLHPEDIAERCSNHPHQVYLEMLSEIGLLGFVLFFTFFMMVIYNSIKFYFKSHNLILLSSCAFIVSQLLPLLPSGSFFTSFSAIIFWTNIGLIYSLIQKDK